MTSNSQSAHLKAKLTSKATSQEKTITGKIEYQLQIKREILREMSPFTANIILLGVCRQIAFVRNIS